MTRRLAILVDAVRRDVTLATRRLRSESRFTVTIVLTLALGIGASTAIFTVASAILVRPLPFPEAERLVVVESTSPKVATPFSVAPGVFEDWRARLTSVESIGGAEPRGVTVAVGDGEARPRIMGRASAGFLSTLGVAPIAGRLFTADDECTAANPEVVLVEEGFWRRELGARPDVVGERLRVDNASPTIVGVVRSGFRFGGAVPELWTPMAPRPNARGGGSITVVGRLKPTVSRQQAQADAETVQQQIAREHGPDRPFGVVVTPLLDWVVRGSRRGLVLLSAAVGVLLIICCANITGLLLARMTARRKEFAVMASLGGTRLRLASEPLAECLIVAAMGGALGWPLAAALVRVVPSIQAVTIARVEDVRIDAGMALLATAVTTLAALLIGVIPALTAARGDVRAALQRGSGAGFITPRGSRLRRGLVAGQLALALVLLAGAGLLVNTLYKLVTTELGFDRSRMVSLRVGLPGGPDPVRDRVLHDALLDRVRALPEVQAATTADQPPLTPTLYPYSLRPPGTPPSQAVQALARHVGPAYLGVLDIGLIAGRDLLPRDVERVPLPVVLNRAAATALFGGPAAAIGRTLDHDYARTRPRLEVVGVADDVRQLGVREAAGPQVYVPSAFSYSRRTYVIARIVPHAAIPASALRAAARSVGGQTSVADVATTEDVFDRELAEPRLYALLLNGLAWFAVVLVALGIYGLARDTVERRTHELGVRLALGATRRHVLALVMRESTTLIVAGTALGVMGALATTRIVSHLLYDVTPHDATTLAVVTALLAIVGTATSWLAARRATRIDPMVALRAE